MIPRFIGDLFVLPRAHKTILGIAVALVVAGWVHSGYRAATDSGTPAATQTSVVAVNPQTPGAPDVQQNSTIESWLARLGRRIGGSVLIGYVIGWVFREFLRIMASITAVIIGLLAFLSYFHVMNVDMTAAEQKYQSASAWITDQAGRLRSTATAHVHSTTGGALGIFLGLRKRTIV